MKVMIYFSVVCMLFVLNSCNDTDSHFNCEFIDYTIHGDDNNYSTWVLSQKINRYSYYTGSDTIVYSINSTMTAISNNLGDSFTIRDRIYLESLDQHILLFVNDPNSMAIDGWDAILFHPDYGILSMYCSGWSSKRDLVTHSGIDSSILSQFGNIFGKGKPWEKNIY